MSDHYRADVTHVEVRDEGAYPAASRRRVVREPLFTGGDVAAFVVSLIMVCGPLAMGAFRL